MNHIVVDKYSLITILCFMLLGAVSTAKADIHPSSDKIRIKGDWAFPPYEFVNDKGEPDGFNVEIIRAVMKEVNVPYELSLEHWSKVVEELRQKKIDVIIGMSFWEFDRITGTFKSYNEAINDYDQTRLLTVDDFAAI